MLKSNHGNPYDEEYAITEYTSIFYTSIIIIISPKPVGIFLRISTHFIEYCLSR